MYVIFLIILICFNPLFSSEVETLNDESTELNLIVDEKVPKYFLKKIDPSIKNKENCDLRCKDVQVINNTIFEKKDIVDNICCNIINPKSSNMYFCDAIGALFSACSGASSTLGCLLYGALSITNPIFSSSIVLRNFFISGVQSILNFTGGVHIF